MLVRVRGVVQNHLAEALNKGFLEDLHYLFLGLLWVHLDKLEGQLVDVGTVCWHSNHICPRRELIEESLCQVGWLLDVDEVSLCEGRPQPSRNVHCFALGQHSVGLARFSGSLGRLGYGSVIHLVKMGQAASILQEGARDAVFFGQNIVDIPVVTNELIFLPCGLHKAT